MLFIVCDITCCDIAYLAQFICIWTAIFECMAQAIAVAVWGLSHAGLCHTTATKTSSRAGT